MALKKSPHPEEPRSVTMGILFTAVFSGIEII